MSTATMRLRRAGAGGLAAAVIAGTMFASAGSALAWSGGLALTYAPTTASTTTITAGGAAASADNVSVTIPAGETWNVNDTLKFDLSATGADCLTTSAFVAWTSLTPTSAFVTSGTTGTLPTFSASNSTAGACLTLGKQTSATLTFTNSGTAPTGGIKITVAHSVQAGSAIADGTAVNVTVTPGGTAPIPAASGALNVADVVAVGITSGTPVVLTPNTAAQAVPDVTVKEAVAGTIPVGAFDITYGPAAAVDISAATATWTGQSVAPVLSQTGNVVHVAITAKTTTTTGAGTLTLKGVKITTNAVTAVTGQGEAVTASIANGSAAALGANANISRVGGSDRYFTAAALYNAKFPAPQTSVIVASGALFPDALSANVLAGATGAGVLLTDPASLSPAAQLAISARAANLTTVYILGGTGAVSATVQAQIKALLSSTATIVRLGGADRYATNELVNNAAAGLTTMSTTAVVATGTGFADALAVGPEVVNRKFGLVLTNPTSLSAAAAATLSNYKSVVIVGGTGALSANVETQIKALGLTVAYRLAGTDRTQTAQQIANWATLGVPAVGTTYAAQAALGFNKTAVHVARGDIFADALAAGPVAAKFAGAGASGGTVILLTINPTSLGAGAPAYVSGLAGATGGANVGTVNGLGLNGAVPTAQLNSVALSILG